MGVARLARHPFQVGLRETRRKPLFAGTAPNGHDAFVELPFWIKPEIDT